MMWIPKGRNPLEAISEAASHKVLKKKKMLPSLSLWELLVCKTASYSYCFLSHWQSWANTESLSNLLIPSPFSENLQNLSKETKGQRKVKTSEETKAWSKIKSSAIHIQKVRWWARQLTGSVCLTVSSGHILTHTYSYFKTQSATS